MVRSWVTQMKNNILNKFAISDLKKHQKDTKIMMITIFIVSLFVMLLAYFTPLILNQDYLKNKSNQGSYTYFYVYDESEQERQISMEEFKNIQLIINGKEKTLKDIPHCFECFYANTLNNETMRELKGDHSILAVNLKSGRMPKQKNEIAVKESVFEHWGYKKKLNSNIQLSYNTSAKNNDHIKIGNFKVVGILEEAGYTDIVVSNVAHSKYDSLYLKTKLNEEIDNREDYYISVNTDTTIEDSVFSKTYALTGILMIVILITIVIIYGMTLSSFEKKQKDYILLRSIGMTQRQMLYVIFLQSLLLSFIPIVLSIMIVYVISLLLPLIIFLPISLFFPMADILWYSFVIYIIVFMSYFFPARSILRRSLTGNFEGLEFQKIYYQYKKLHQMRPFYLAWRQVVSVKKKMIMKVILIALIVVFSMNMVGNLIISFHNQQILSNQHTNNVEDIIYEIDLEEQKYNQNDFKFFQDSAKNIIEINYMSSASVLMESTRKGTQSFDYYGAPKVYCTNQHIQDYYQLPNINKGEMIMTSAALNGFRSKFKTNDKITFLNKKYHIKQIIENDQDSIIFLHQSDFKQTCTYERKMVIVDFKDISMKTKCLLERSKQYAEFEDKYNRVYSDYEEVNNDYLDIIRSGIMKIAAVSIIYIYQFSFELLKQKEDIGSYQLLGFTHKEIRSIYFYKSLIIGFIGFLFGMIYYLLDIYYKYYSLISMKYLFTGITNMIVFIVSFMIIVFIIALSLTPLYYILKKDAFENKNTRE